MRLSRFFGFTFFLLFLLNFSYSYSIGYYPDLSFSKSAELPKSGKIKFREDWIYKIENGSVVSVGIKAGYEKYNNLGLKLEEASYDMDGNVLMEATYTYDEWGREDQCLGLKDYKSFFNKWTYSFNEKDKVLEKKLFNNPSNNNATIYHFDEAGNVIKEMNFDEQGVLNYRYEIKYTNFNRPAELIEYGANGELFEKWVYVYNKDNQNIEVRQYDANLALFKKYINSFDEKGIQKEILTYDKEGNAIEKRVSVYQFF